MLVPKSEPKPATSRNLLEICCSARPPGEDCHIEITRCVVLESLLYDSLNVSVAMSVAPHVRRVRSRMPPLGSRSVDEDRSEPHVLNLRARS